MQRGFLSSPRDSSELVPSFPALKRRAILDRPSGTWSWRVPRCAPACMGGAAFCVGSIQPNIEAQLQCVSEAGLLIPAKAISTSAQEARPLIEPLAEPCPAPTTNGGARLRRAVPARPRAPMRIAAGSLSIRHCNPAKLTAKAIRDGKLPAHPPAAATPCRPSIPPKEPNRLPSPAGIPYSSQSPALPFPLSPHPSPLPPHSCLRSSPLESKPRGN